jgi:hypothetical protein
VVLNLFVIAELPFECVLCHFSNAIVGVINVLLWFGKILLGIGIKNIVEKCHIILKTGVLGCCAYKAWRLQDVQRENSKKKFDPSAPILFRSIQSFFWLLVFVYFFSVFVITFCFSCSGVFFFFKFLK